MKRLRNIRVDDEQWERWQRAAEERATALSDFVRACVEDVLDAGGLPKPTVWKTASGKVLTDEDIQKLADEAERGYDPAEFIERPPLGAPGDKGPSRRPGGGSAPATPGAPSDDLAPKQVRSDFKPETRKKK